MNILSAMVDDTNTSQAATSCDTEQTPPTLASPCPRFLQKDTGASVPGLLGLI